MLRLRLQLVRDATLNSRLLRIARPASRPGAVANVEALVSVANGQRFQKRCVSPSCAEEERSDGTDDERDDEDTQGCGEQQSRIEGPVADDCAPLGGCISEIGREPRDDILAAHVCDPMVMSWLFIAPSLVCRWSKGWAGDGIGLNGQRMAYKRMGTLTGFKGSKLARGGKAGLSAKDSFGGSQALVDSIDADPEFTCDFLGLVASHDQA